MAEGNTLDSLLIQPRNRIVRAFKAMRKPNMNANTYYISSRHWTILNALWRIQAIFPEETAVGRRKGRQPYMKSKRNSLIKARGCWIWKTMVTLYRKHLHIFNCFYKLHQRIEAGWHSLKSIVDNLIRNKTNHNNRNLVENHLLQSP